MTRFTLLESSTQEKVDLIYTLSLVLPVLFYGLILLLITLRLRTGADNRQFFLADRNLGPLPAMVSVIATETSAATIIVFPATGMNSGLALVWLCVGYILGRFLVARFYLEKIYLNHELSLYRNVTGNSGPGGDETLSLFYLASKYVSSGIRFCLCGFALYQLFGGSVAGWILLTATIAGIYSLSGGLRAVVITDQLQGYIILFFGIVLLVLLAFFPETTRLPGVASRNLPEITWPALINTTLSWTNSGNFLFLLFGGLVLSIGTHGADQDMLQRVLAVRDVKAARRALAFSGPGATVVILIFLLIGHFLPATGILSALDNKASWTKQSPLVEYIRLLNIPTLLGSFAVLLFAAAMSTIDSAIHSTGAVWKDLTGSKKPGRVWSFLSLTILTLTALAFIIPAREKSFLSLALGSMNYINGGLIALLTLYVFKPARISRAAIFLALSGGLFTTILCNFAFENPLAWPLVTVLSAGIALLFAFMAGGRVQAG